MECFELIEHKLIKGPWVMGEKYTICDPYLFTIASWIEGDGVDTTKVPRVMEHRAHMLARPVVQKAVAAEGTQIPYDHAYLEWFRKQESIASGQPV